MSNTQYKQQLAAYFDGEGFTRWQAIYGDAPLSRVRQSVRAGHATMLAQALGWLDEAPTGRALDAGCGTGLLTLALAQRGWYVHAQDIAPQMVRATADAAQAAGLSAQVTSTTGDLEAASGRYDTVACLDVLIHYPEAMLVPALAHLAALTDGPLLFTYAPRTAVLGALHRIGGWFPRPERRTTVQLIAPAAVDRALAACGRQVRRSVRISRGFYHVALVEAR